MRNLGFLLAFTAAVSGGSQSSGGKHRLDRQTMVPPNYGLKDGYMSTASGVAVGFHIDWNAGEVPQTIGDRLGKEMAIIGSYVHLDLTNQTYWEMEASLPSILPLASTTVYSPAILPSFKLDKWTPEMTATLASRMQALNAQGLSVWLRFAYEMNGEWMAFGHDPTNYVRVWKEITQAVRAVAPTTLMLWAPNFCDDKKPDTNLDTYAHYYPGAEYVDIAGLSFYHTGANQLENTQPLPTDFENALHKFYGLYASAHPIVLAETAGVWHYEVPPRYQYLGQDSEIPGGADSVDWASCTPSVGDSPSEYDLKTAWFDQMSSPATKARFPKLCAVMWFNFAKINGIDGILKLNDFRAVKLPNDALTIYFRSQIGREPSIQHRPHSHKGIRAVHHVDIREMVFGDDALELK